MKHILQFWKELVTKMPKNIFVIQKIGRATKITRGNGGFNWENGAKPRPFSH